MERPYNSPRAKLEREGEKVKKEGEEDSREATR